IAGVIIGKQKDIDQIIMGEHELLGAKMAPFEGWLILRSLRTLQVRMDAHMKKAMAIAAFLETKKEVVKVNYPGLKSFSQYELGKKQMSGFSSLMSFQLRTKDIDKIKNFVNHLKLFRLGVSWGGHDSLVYAPVISYLKELSPDKFEAMGIDAGLIRISVGLEDTDDMINDLNQALASTI
ncbi:MAG: PLP-dependent transferase, partial [Bacteroidia bacterium]|nr:PLP-dependent transferase [Bacteroidia bacterium]